MSDRKGRWRSLGRILLFLCCSAFVLVLTSALPFARTGVAQTLVIGAITSTGSLALTALFIRWDGLRLRDVGAMPNRGSLGRLAIGFMIGLSLVALHSYLVGVVGHVRLIRTAAASLEQAGLIFLGYVLLSAREELAFHGYPLRRLQPVLGIWPAQAMIAVVFAIEHMTGGWSYSQALWGAATGSLLFGMASIATRGLAVPIGIHAAWNFGDWIRGNRADIGVWRPEIQTGFEGAASWAGIWCYVLIMILATLGFWFWHRAQNSVFVRDT
jgi:membrane protease YdiL (CAAX protease family)